MKRLKIAAAVAAVVLSMGPDAHAVTFRTVALTGDVAPGTGGATFNALGVPSLNSVGEVAFFGNLIGTGITPTNDGGLFTSSALVAREGDTAPGTGGATLSGFGGLPALNDSGDMAFQSFLTGTGITGANNTGIFTSSALVARTGDPAPGTGGATFAGLGGFLVLNDGGETAFNGRLTGAGVTEANNTGIFTSSAPVAREGDPAPGTGGATLSNFGPVALNDGGEVAFSGALTSPGATGVNGSGIFTSSALVARKGDAAPGTGGASFSGFGGFLSLNGSGETAFFGNLTGAGVTGANDSGLFTTSALVAREGDPAPGTGGATYSGFFGSPALNDSGALAFLGFFTGPGVTNANNGGLFRADAGGIVEMILREGDLLDVGGGDLRTIFNLSFFRTGFNDNGDIAFSARFTDGSSGIFVAESGVAPVPLPASAWLFLAALGGLGLIRARQRAA